MRPVLLTAELVIKLRHLDVNLWPGKHLRSANNYLADALSRLCQGYSVPQALASVPRTAARERDNFWTSNLKPLSE